MLVFCVLQVQHQFQKNICPCSALHNPLLLELVNRKGTEIQKTRNLCPCSASKLLFLVIALSSLLSLQLLSFTLPLFSTTSHSFIPWSSALCSSMCIHSSHICLALFPHHLSPSFALAFLTLSFYHLLPRPPLPVFFLPLLDSTQTWSTN